jgi:hypothetical protein
MMSPEQTERESRQEESETEHDGRAAKHAEQKFRVVIPLRLSHRERKGHRHTDDPQEERKDKIGEGPSVPFGVCELRIDVPPGAGIIHQDHSGDGESAECIKRDESFGFHIIFRYLTVHTANPCFGRRALFRSFVGPAVSPVNASMNFFPFSEVGHLNA